MESHTEEKMIMIAKMEIKSYTYNKGGGEEGEKIQLLCDITLMGKQCFGKEQGTL